ncbi:hypothetical protein [Leptospira koniambonensis]|uniref:hypothetical protein n=1 Tax=Leptospira koniambonensis TaxID=2484950 RepID=UPI003EB81F2D
MRKFILLFFAFLTFDISFADDSKAIVSEIKKAASISNDQSRLREYDKIAEKYKLRSPAVAKTMEKGKWNVSVGINPLDDTKTYVFLIIADSGRSKWNSPISLAVRKSSQGNEIYINWGDYLGSEANVTFRVGNAEATQSEWNLSSDSKASFYNGSVESLIQEISKVDRVVAQCIPYNESPITAIFDVRGFKEISSKYNDDLNWW